MWPIGLIYYLLNEVASQLPQEGVIISPILQMSKLWLREADFPKITL